MGWETHPDAVRLANARQSRVADAVATATDPALLVIAVLAVVAAKFSASLWWAAAWSVMAALFCVGVPYFVLMLLIGKGHVLDRHVVIREQRRWPLLAALASVVIGLSLLAWLGAPRSVVALVAAMLAGLAAMTTVSHWYKASFHLAVAGGVAVILGLVLGWLSAVVLLPVLAIIGWARLRAGRHTVGQTVAGFLVGALAAGVVYPPLA